ncbi:MAG: zinc ribbon domain-containing protein [Chloroflexi bacterium]|nr:zinc ribbon domain-containing protein [Chloroflexota bacterium]
MTEEARCPRCGKRLVEQATFCPSCGMEFLPHRLRIRCNHCSHRIPAEMLVCPRCGADPRAGRLPIPRVPRRIAKLSAILIGSFLLLCIGWVIFRAITTNALARLVGLSEPASVPTQVIEVIYIVATSVPPAPTLVPTLAPTPIPRTTATTTRRGGPTPTATRRVPTPAPAMYPAPQLIGPLDRTVFAGTGANIVLQWQPVSPIGLRENEWYQISVAYTGRDNKRVQQIGWAKETRWTVPAEWWSDISPESRILQWNLTVIRVEGIDPIGSPNKAPASPPSGTRAFIWN